MELVGVTQFDSLNVPGILHSDQFQEIRVSSSC